ncbi:hypothetical protein NDU88_009335, partial [Pleurodeles waltl]
PFLQPGWVWQVGCAWVSLRTPAQLHVLTIQQSRCRAAAFSRAPVPEAYLDISWPYPHYLADLQAG